MGIFHTRPDKPSGAHPVSCTVDTGSLSPGVKQPGCGVDHPPPSLAPRLKKEYRYTFTHPLGLRGLLQFVASFLAGGGCSGGGGRAYWVWRSGKGWVFIYLELVACTCGGGVKTREQTWRYISELLLTYRLKIPPAKNRALHYVGWPLPLPFKGVFLYIVKTAIWHPCAFFLTFRWDSNDFTYDVTTATKPYFFFMFETRDCKI